jgi:hypothetical protein
LLLVVAVPMTAAATAAVMRVPRGPDALVVAGLLLVGWIAVQVPVVRVFSWLQPVCLAAGALVVLLGWRARGPT